METALVIKTFSIATLACAMLALGCLPCIAGLISDSKTIKLPTPSFIGPPLEETLKARRSVRDYSDKPVELAELSQLLYAAQGITGKSGSYKLRSSPSAGALYPMELYVFAHNVNGIKPGLYHYDPVNHSLSLIKKGNLADDLMRAGLRQGPLSDAALVIVLTAFPERTTKKYGNRGEGYVLMEAGHIGQNVLLQAVSLGLGAVPIGAFDDKKLNRLMDIKEGSGQTPLYLQAVGAIR